jgi:GNAT superfamily N-acetyltransferase
MPVVVRPLTINDLSEADRIYRLAFGTFLGLPDPGLFDGDAEVLISRWHIRSAVALALEVDARVVGSNWLTRWGTLGMFGPLTIHPAHWLSGLAQRLLEPTLEFMRQPGITHAALFTFGHSPLHVGLYQKFGYWPGGMIAVMEKTVPPKAGMQGAVRYSEIPPAQRTSCLAECRALTSALHDGLDLTSEIVGLDQMQLGDTVLLVENSRVIALAVCHIGAKSEAGSGNLYVKFGAVHPGPGALEHFTRLLSATEALAVCWGVHRLVAGTNAMREQAFRALLAFGLRPWLQGLAMHLDNKPVLNHPDAYVVDDWR